jgi:thiol:disulfide interchange protein DsbA
LRRIELSTEDEQMMYRREFAKSAAAGLAAAALPAWAQWAWKEGTHYVRLAQPAPVGASAGKIEVLEFFWYGCPHCHELEPALDEWVRKLPAEVAFRRVPVGFAAVHETHQRLFYTLEAMGKLDALHRKIFAAIHLQRQRLDREGDQATFVGAQGVDAAQFSKLWRDATITGKVQQAKRLVDAYKIDGVPAIGVHGRFYTAGSLAGDNKRALQVADFLIQQAKRGT